MSIKPPSSPNPNPPGSRPNPRATKPIQVKEPPQNQNINSNNDTNNNNATDSDESANSSLIDSFIKELRILGAALVYKYKILQAVGKGKFAVVYRAQHCESNEIVAVKKVQIFETMNVSSREKCLREIKLLESLQHPHIIQYLNSYIEPETNELVIVLQWAKGGDLKKQLRKKKSEAEKKDSEGNNYVGSISDYSFTENEIWRYTYELSSGLSYMHSKRVMHRDLKPANIMLGSDNHVLLGDLGLSRYFTEQTMEAFSKVGTPLYISPEVLTGNGYSFAADCWSLGCILYELCCLVSPFKPQSETVNLFQLFANIKQGKYTQIPRTNQYSEELIQLIESMMNIDPQLRPNLESVCDVASRRVAEKEKVKISRPVSANRPLSAAAVLRPPSASKNNPPTPTNVNSNGKSLQPISEQTPVDNNVKSPNNNNNNNNLTSPTKSASNGNGSATVTSPASAKGNKQSDTGTNAKQRADSEVKSQQQQQEIQKKKLEAEEAEKLRQQQREKLKAAEAAEAKRKAAEEAEAEALRQAQRERESLEAERIRLKSQMEEREKRRKQGEDTNKNNNTTEQPNSNGIAFINVDTKTNRNKKSSVTSPPNSGNTPTSVSPIKSPNPSTNSKPPLPQSTSSNSGANANNNNRPQSSNPNSRPSSAKSKEIFDLAAQDPEIILEETLEKLKLLNYEQLFCKLYDFQWLTHNYFCIPLKSPQTNRIDHTQFVYFVYLCLWLLQHVSATNSLELQAYLIEYFDRQNQKDAVYIQDSNQRNQLIQCILASMKNCNISMGNINLDDKELRSGYGKSVCLLLARLLDHIFMFRLFKPPNKQGQSTLSILSGSGSNPNSRPNSAFNSLRNTNSNTKSNWSLPMPSYDSISSKASNERGEINTMIIGAHNETEHDEEKLEEEPQEETLENIQDEPADETQEDDEIAIHSPSSATAADQNQHLPIANRGTHTTKQWQLEYEKVIGTGLLTTTKKSSLHSSSVIDHIDTGLKHFSLLTTNSNPTTKQLGAHSNTLSKFLEQVSFAEKHLQKSSSLTELQHQMQSLQNGIDTLTQHNAEYSEEIHNQKQVLNNLENKVSELKASITEKNNASSDSGPLLKVKNSIKNIHTDIATMNMKIEIAQSLVLKHRIKQQAQHQRAVHHTVHHKK